MPSQPDTLDYFRLKPIRAARVSEISETTAAAPIPDEERINFHIGNPLQDGRLSSTFLRIALGLDVYQEDLTNAKPEAILENLGWEPSDQPKLELIAQTIQKSIPYMPRGGYARNAPHALVQAFRSWLEHQQESLRYDFGEQSGRREVVLTSGGISEALRVMFFAISSYLEVTPARILCYQIELAPHLKHIPNLLFYNLDADERTAREEIEQYLNGQPEIPTFLLMGGLLGEETRRKLRRLSLERPLFFLEANNAPNHLSLAREAKLVQRVIRFLTPAIFSPRLHILSTVFVAGNADFLNIIENIHFNLKGTPSASEVELLIYLLEHRLSDLSAETSSEMPWVKLSFENLASGTAADNALPQLAERTEQHLNRLLEDHAQILAHSLSILEAKVNASDWRIRGIWQDRVIDEFSTVPANELLELLVQNIHQPAWAQALQRSLISAFVKHQPQYHPEACLVASGSSRTALGILGFHCGIREVVMPDLSWSYEQCFPVVHAVPLTASLELDVEAILEKVEELCWQDPTWPNRGAVVINNPHNATGKVFAEADVRRLITYCLQHNLYLIDDLAYQNVAPVDDLPEIQTVRQITSELARIGVLNEEQANRVITVHSLSKTDCLAGARLAIIEIREQRLRQRFEEINATIQPNIAAIFISYLFYRGSLKAVRTYWHLRNRIFQERTLALLKAVENLPSDRNPFGLAITPPMGSMYPLLQIQRLPDGLSLDWLASSLSRQGIGLLPLATFARTEKGYETGRTSFRLTLGGVDSAEILLAKTRRLLIDMNRLIAEEQARYNRKLLPHCRLPDPGPQSLELSNSWNEICKQIILQYQNSPSFRRSMRLPPLEEAHLQREFLQQYVPARLEVFRARLLDRALISEELKKKALNDSGWLAERLEREFMKDLLQRRQELFRLRSYDRTVHPTQMYSLPAELALNAIVEALITRQPVDPALIEKSAYEIMLEYLGRNVAITSQQEADEILLDLDALTASEEYVELFTDTTLSPLLSFWSDWDGSSRPSGQGHRLVSAVVMENVQRLARILKLLRQASPHIPLDADLISELERLPQRNQRFTQLLNAITLLTHQLEQRYRGILSFSPELSTFQRLTTRWHLRRDPARILWEHNDRYERKMLELRQQRRRMLEDYFALNKKLRKQLYALIPEILNNLTSERLLYEVARYRDLLQRTVITPRIHQGMITMRDQFAIDTTVYNIHEINLIAGKYGNPGMTLALQVSLATKPEALISLDRKMRTQGEQMRRVHPSVELPSIWLIPLFEDLDAVREIRPYLDRLWDYATQSRQTWQTPQNRFSEIISEVFIAGSDLSQQVGQAAGAFLYRKAKYELQSWLAEHGVAETVRLKFGSGEAMQRQGNYYSRVAGQPAFLNSTDNRRRFSTVLPAAARKSTAYAVTPLQGVFLGGDLRTFQSNLSEQLRSLPVGDLSNLLYHVRETQLNHRKDLIRAAETIVESRMEAQSRSAQELVRLTIGMSDALYESFLEELTDNFRQILYGREEDVVGIHIISYFIGRTLPQLRDRPLSRQLPGAGDSRGGQSPASIAEIIPLAKQGSLMRAIAHNQAQTVVLGINQLTTGLFRALERFAQKALPEAERERMIAERILPHLPVYEILNTLRLYQDWKGEFLHRIETAFPAGNSAFVALREDSDAMQRYLPLFQQELLRRHGVNVNDFFNEGIFIPDLLPTLRPDLAVLLQKNLFNTSIDLLLEKVTGRISNRWQSEVRQMLQIPQKIHFWRSVIWDVIGETIYQRVHSFAELVTALYSFSTSRALGATPAAIRGKKISPALAGFLRTARIDDEMRPFLISTIEYLSSFAEGSLDVPVSILRAMNDVERIAQIEKRPLPPMKRDVIRCCVLQIARLAGENG